MSGGEIYPEFWTETRKLTVNARYLYLWTFSNSHGNTAGLYPLPDDDVIAFETGIPKKAIGPAMDELEEHGFISRDGGWLWVRAKVKRIRNRVPNMAKGIANTLKRLDRHHPLRTAFLFEYQETEWLAATLAPLLVRDQMDVELGEASELISSMLADGPVAAREVMQAAVDAGIDQKALRRAKENLGVKSVQEGGHWIWVLRVVEPGVGSLSMASDGEGRLPKNPRDRDRESSSTSESSTTVGDTIRSGSAASAEVADSLPADLPAELAVAAEECLVVLARVAEAKGALVPRLAGVGRAVQMFPRKAHVQTAGALEHWALYGRGQGRPMRDVTATFRNFLRSEPDVFAAGVVPLRRGSVFDAIDAISDEGEAA